MRDTLRPDALLLLGLSQFLQVWMLFGFLIRMIPWLVQNFFGLFLRLFRVGHMRLLFG